MSFKKAREAAGFSLHEAAEQIGVSFQAISLWENGKTMPKASKLLKIAEVYGCSVNDLITSD